MGVQGQDDSGWICSEGQGKVGGERFSQVCGVDYGDVFVPVSWISNFRLLLAFTVELKMTFEQMDFITVFLNSRLDEKEVVHIKLPK
jgi:hypothetical protein